MHEEQQKKIRQILPWRITWNTDTKQDVNFWMASAWKKVVTKWPSMFCNATESDEFTKGCTTDRLGLGYCALKNNYDSPVPGSFQYFASDKKGGKSSSLTDYCPVVEHDRYWECTNTELPRTVPGCLFSKNSMCLDGNALKVQMTSGASAVGGVCAEISCEGGSVKVKYHCDKTIKWHDCPEGQSLTPSSISTSFVSGTIKCPKYKEVRTVAPDDRSFFPEVIIKPIEPKTGTSPTALQDPKASQKPTGKKNDSNSGKKSKDGSSVPFGLIPSVAVLILSFAGYLIA